MKSILLIVFLAFSYLTLGGYDKGVRRMVPFGNFGWNFGFGFGWILIGVTVILMVLGIVRLLVQVKTRQNKPRSSNRSEHE
jgi:hypothetical protein